MVIAMSEHEAKFQVGKIVHHKLFDYIGVVFDVDPEFQGTDEWYQHVALGSAKGRALVSCARE